MAALFSRLWPDGQVLAHDQIEAWWRSTSILNVRSRTDDDWSSLAVSLLADRAEELQEALTFNRLTDILLEVERLLPSAPERTLHLLAWGLRQPKYWATYNRLLSGGLENMPPPGYRANSMCVAVKFANAQILDPMRQAAPGRGN